MTAPEIDENGVALTSTSQDPNQTSGGKVKKIQEICFNCWSAGTGKTCDMHVPDGPTKIVRGNESVMVCGNWDLGVMRRRYRDEGIQEVRRAVAIC